MRVLQRIGFVLAGAMLLGACASSGEGPAPPAQPGDAAVPPPGSGGQTLVVRVIGAPGHHVPAPMPWVVVALDAPGGSRHHAFTDENGRVEFGGLDFEQGTAAVTVAAPGYPLASRVDIAGATEEITVTLYGLTGPLLNETARISGTARNTAKPSTTLEVTATTSRHRSVHAGPEWGIVIPPGTPFAIAAVERGAGGVEVSPRGRSQWAFGWVWAEHPAVGVDATVDLDFARPEKAFETHGSFALPVEHTVLGMLSRGTVTVVSDLDVGAQLGLATYIDVDAAAERFEYVVQWIEPAAIVTPRTVFMLAEPNLGFERTWVALPGYPTRGAQSIAFLRAPTLRGSRDPATRRPLHDTIAWHEIDAGTTVRLLVLRGVEVAWVVEAAPGAGALRVPLAPLTVDEGLLLGAGPLGGLLEATDTPASRGPIRGSLSALFALTP